jgi:glycosyltransferase involved in cell wall biosynthesis
VLYISYDGASEPLGRSQVVAYLVRLAPSSDITLISFEKPSDERSETRELLANAGIKWIPLRYHRRPPVLSTAWDIAHGAWVTRRAARRDRTQIIHTRSYVAGTIALLSMRRRSWKFLFDIRGFWVDERVDGKLWQEGGWLYRLGKRCERWLFRSADAVVTLTAASVPQIKAWLSVPAPPVSVIPTCVDLDRYQQKARLGSPYVVWCGSIGTVYRFDLATALADALNRPLKVLTRQVDLARTILDGREADVRSVPHEQMANELTEGDIGLCLYSTGFSLAARAPTRFGEYLAAGMVVGVTPGIGDLDKLVTEHRVGAVLHTDSEDSIRTAAHELRELADDVTAPDRCRALAAQLFGIEAGVQSYLALYQALLCEARPGLVGERNPRDMVAS